MTGLSFIDEAAAFRDLEMIYNFYSPPIEPSGFRRQPVEAPRRNGRPAHIPEITNYQEAIAFGAREMDRLRPDWFLDIDLDILSLQLGHDCVLGQLFGDFSRGLRKLNLSEHDGVAMGLDLYWSLDDPADRDGLWERMTEYWAYEVEARIDAAVV